MTEASRLGLKAVYFGSRTMVHMDMDNSTERARQYANETLSQYIYNAINSLMQADGYDIPATVTILDRVVKTAWKHEAVWMKHHGCPNVERFVYWRYR